MGNKNLISKIMKGAYNQECNITSCQKPNSAVWFNHSTRKYYCPSCARRLNEDVFNARDAKEMFGHTLCTLEDREATIGELLAKETEQLLSVLKDEISLVNEYKCGRENRRERRKRERKNK